MSRITLQWLQSEPMSDIMKYGGELWAQGIAKSQTTLVWVIAALTVTLAFCLVWLLISVIRKKRKHRDTLRVQSPMADFVTTQELPVAAVLATGQFLHTLEDIFYCESKEIII